MRTIAYATMYFLPATFLSAFFNIAFLQSGIFQDPHYNWIYFLSVMALIVLVLYLWRVWLRQRMKRVKGNEARGLLGGSPLEPDLSLCIYMYRRVGFPISNRSSMAGLEPFAPGKILESVRSRRSSASNFMKFYFLALRGVEVKCRCLSFRPLSVKVVLRWQRKLKLEDIEVIKVLE
jgi:hypothetical protein